MSDTNTAPAVSADKRPDEKWFNYRLKVNGVWGRNRSVKFDSWKIAESPQPTSLLLSDVEPKMRVKLAEIGFKRGSITLVEEPVTRSWYNFEGRQLETEMFELFSGRVMHREDKQ